MRLVWHICSYCYYICNQKSDKVNFKFAINKSVIGTPTAVTPVLRFLWAKKRKLVLIWNEKSLSTATAVVSQSASTSVTFHNMFNSLSASHCSYITIFANRKVKITKDVLDGKAFAASRSATSTFGTDISTAYILVTSTTVAVVLVL